MIRVIEIVLQTLKDDTIITKRWVSNIDDDGRDIYYRDTMLFGKQGTVDRILDLLAYTLLIPRSCLNVVCRSYDVVD